LVEEERRIFGKFRMMEILVQVVGWDIFPRTALVDRGFFYI
jgi:hypothetical protein